MRERERVHWTPQFSSRCTQYRDALRNLDTANARLLESRLLAISGHGGDSGNPTLNLFSHVCVQFSEIRSVRVNWKGGCVRDAT